LGGEAQGEDIIREAWQKKILRKGLEGTFWSRRGDDSKGGVIEPESLKKNLSVSV